MNICHVNLSSNYCSSQQQTYQLIKHQVRQGYTLTVVINPDNELIRDIRKLGCTIVLAKKLTKAHSKKITKHCNVIHTHENRAAYWGLIQYLLYGIPYVITRRTDIPLSNKWVSKLAYRKASAIIGLSQSIVSKIKELNDPTKVHLIPSTPIQYPIDQNKVDQIWNQFRGKFIVLHCAGMLKEKGFQTTIAAAKLLGVKNPRIQFVLLGDGPEQESLKHEARGLTNISFMGRQRDMGTWFAAAELLIHPSYNEGLGSVILDAIEAGLPIIGSNTGGIPDIIEHKVSGLLCEPGNAKHLAEQIDQLENNHTLRHQLKINAKQKLKQFNIVDTAALYKNVYTQASSTNA